MARWYERNRGQERLALESQAMQRFHPQFVLRKKGSGTLYYRGELTTSVEGATYVVEVVFQPNHPNGAPAAYVRSPDLRRKRPPHMYGDGKLCLYRPGDGPRSGYAPETTTAATIVGWAAAWLHAYEIWKRTGHWPGPDGHGHERY